MAAANRLMTIDTSQPPASKDWAELFEELLARTPLLSLTDCCTKVVQDSPTILQIAAKCIHKAQEIIADNPDLKYLAQQWVASGKPVAYADLIGVIRLYTQEFKDGKSMYTNLTDALTNTGAQNGPKFDRWIAMAKLLDEALLALPEKHRLPASGVAYVQAYRGVKWRYPDPQHPNPEKHFPIEGQRTLWTFTSHSLEKKVLGQFAGKDPSQPRTVFDVRVTEGFDITAFSEFKAEKEILLRPLSRFRIIGASDGSPTNSADVVTLHQLPRELPPAPLIPRDVIVDFSDLFRGIWLVARSAAWLTFRSSRTIWRLLLRGVERYREHRALIQPNPNPAPVAPPAPKPKFKPAGVIPKPKPANVYGTKVANPKHNLK